MGLGSPDDAAVYRLTDEIALVQTVDFFTPIVDDPYDFGAIAAANALSDVYAMGGEPLCAMNIACFPDEAMDISVLREILRGGLDKAGEAGAQIVGGHTVTDEELKYGLAVTGIVRPEAVLHKRGGRAGDLLVLTKPLGTGIVNTAVKGDLAEADLVARVTRSMAALNRDAARLLAEREAHACTDVTGFGLAGHAAEMIQGTGLAIRLFAGALPFFTEARDFADMGLLPAGLHRNREHRAEMFRVDAGVPRHLVDLVFDPQTSGGLLAALPPDDAVAWAADLASRGIEAAVAGEIVEGIGEVVELADRSGPAR